MQLVTKVMQCRAKTFKGLRSRDSRDQSLKKIPVQSSPEDVEVTTKKIQIQEVVEDTAAMTEDPTEVNSSVLEVRGPKTMPL